MISTLILKAVNTPQDIVVPGGISGYAAIRLSFKSPPSSGTITFERQDGYNGEWLPIPGGSNLDVTGGAVQVEFDGGVYLLRATFAGLVGGEMPVLTIAGSDTATPPSWLMTDGGFGPAARLRVDNGQTGFFARRMWVLTYEFASANPIAGTPLVFRVTVPVNFIVHAHSLSVDQGGVTLRTYSASQGSAGGTFGTAHAVASDNTMSEQAAYAFQAAIASGGTFTPSPGQSPITALRVRTAGSTAQQSSVGGSAVSEKGRAAGTYYAILQRMTGVNGDCTGVYNLVVEERP